MKGDTSLCYAYILDQKIFQEDYTKVQEFHIMNLIFVRVNQVNFKVSVICFFQYPPGMKQIVLSFFTRLLSRIKQPLLAHVNVYKAVQVMVVVFLLSFIKYCVKLFRVP